MILHVKNDHFDFESKLFKKYLVSSISVHFQSNYETPLIPYNMFH